MGIVSKSVTGLFAASGLVLFSQAPEFAQQYRQRLGGAIDELKAVVADFDKDAKASTMNRAEALEKMLASPEQFSRDRGASMSRSIARFDALSRQQAQMEKAHPVTRPLFVLQYPDRTVLEGAWKIFEPALPFTTPGAVYGGIGALLMTIFARMGVASARSVARRRAAVAAKAGDRPADINVESAAEAARRARPLPSPVLRPGSGPIPQRYPPRSASAPVQRHLDPPDDYAPDDEAMARENKPVIR